MDNQIRRHIIQLCDKDTRNSDKVCAFEAILSVDDGYLFACHSCPLVIKRSCTMPRFDLKVK